MRPPDVPPWFDATPLLRRHAAVAVAGRRLRLAGLGCAVLAEGAGGVERDAVLHGFARLLGAAGGFLGPVLDALAGGLRRALRSAARVLTCFLCFLAGLLRVFRRGRLLRE